MIIDVEKLPFKKKLWEHQLAALAKIDKYASQRKTSWDKSCLVTIPTGTGKTGIIATLAHFSQFDHVLILTPRLSITSQNFENIKKDFFDIVRGKVSDKEVIDGIPPRNKLKQKWILLPLR